MKITQQVTLVVTLLVSLVVMSPKAEAIKSLSGGNGQGGTLFDINEYGKSERLSPKVINDLMIGEFGWRLKRFPFFFRQVTNLVSKKAWYLETRKFHPDRQNQSIIDAKKEIWACQNLIEVRMRKQVWDNWTDKQKANLIFHEVLTAIRFDDQLFEAVRPALYAFQSETFSDADLKDEFLRLGFRPLMTFDDNRFLGWMITKLVLDLSRAYTKGMAFSMVEQETLRVKREAILDSNEQLILRLASEDIAFHNIYGNRVYSFLEDDAVEFLYKGWLRSDPFTQSLQNGALGSREHR